MSIGQYLINYIESRRERNRRQLPWPHGDFYRHGGASLLYELPIETGELIIDAGGFEGEWTEKMIARYGCRSEIFEPVPAFVEHCRQLFKNNKLVRIHAAALGRAVRSAKFNLSTDGTSEFKSDSDGEVVEALVMDVAEVVNQAVACLKLNIEGGEYDVLERLLETGGIAHCRTLLIQFHAQPPGWQVRLHTIEARLRETHDPEWSYPLIWAKWVRRSNAAD